MSVEVCEAWLSARRIQQMVLSFSSSPQNGDHSSPSDLLFSISVQPPTSLSGLYAPKSFCLYLTLSLLFFLSFTFLLFVLQSFQRHTSSPVCPLLWDVIKKRTSLICEALKVTGFRLNPRLRIERFVVKCKPWLGDDKASLFEFFFSFFF